MSKPRLDIVDLPSTIVRRQSVHATVIRACQNCGAPGAFHAIKSGENPNCYDPVRRGQPVGPICPECGAIRPSDEDKGEIWRREFRARGEGICRSLSRYASTAFKKLRK